MDGLHEPPASDVRCLNRAAEQTFELHVDGRCVMVFRAAGILSAVAVARQRTAGLRPRRLRHYRVVHRPSGCSVANSVVRPGAWAAFADRLLRPLLQPAWRAAGLSVPGDPDTAVWRRLRYRLGMGHRAAQLGASLCIAGLVSIVWLKAMA